MAGVSIESGGNGRRPTDANVNMVPMIDLLVSVIAFLLMTAVWVQTGAVQATQPRTSPSVDPVPPPPASELKIAISSAGLRVAATAADARDIANGPARLDELRAVLAARHRADARQREVWIQPDSTVRYDDIVRVMDVVYDVWSDGRPGARADAVTVRLL